MIGYLIAATTGFLLAKMLEEEAESDNFEHFFVFVRIKDHGKQNMTFTDYKTAKRMYDKIISAKKVKYRDVVDNSWPEMKFYEEQKKKGKINEIPNLSDELKVEEVIFGRGSDDFEKKEF